MTVLNIFVPIISPSMLRDSSNVLFVTSSILNRLFIVPVSTKLISVTSNPASNVAFLLKNVSKLKFCTKSETLVLAASTLFSFLEDSCSKSVSFFRIPSIFGNEIKFPLSLMSSFLDM